MSDEARLLILETSGRAGLVALARGKGLLGERRLEEARRHARDLVPSVKALLDEQGWTPRDLDGVVVSRGPGSYTGLRVGLASAKTLAYATSRPLYAIDTFAAIARQAPPEADRLDVLADAQQGKVYVQPFRRAAEWESLAELRILPFAEWLTARDPAAWVSGPGLRVHESSLAAGARVVEAAARDPWPESLLHLALARRAAGASDDPWTIEPLYLRPSSAEEQWDKRKE